MSPPCRMVLLTSGNRIARRIATPLFSAPDIDVVGIVQVTGDYYGQTGLSAALKLAPKMALPVWLWKVGLAVADRAGATGGVLSLEELADSAGAAQLEVPKVNCREVGDFLRRLAPDVMVSISCPQRVSPKLLAIPTVGALNIHSSLLPSYAGLAPYVWVLVEGEQHAGTTVHWMVPKLDEGRVLAQRTVRVERRESAHHLFERLADAGAEALLEAIRAAVAGAEGSEQAHDQGSYYSHPTLRDWLRMRRRGHRLVRLRDWWHLVAPSPQEQ